MNKAASPASMVASDYMTNPSNSFVEQIAQPSTPCIHCFSSFFFQKLPNKKELNSYNYFTSVQFWSNHIKGHLAQLRKLYVPLIKYGNHWLRMRINPAEKQIEILWDSLGHRPSNWHFIVSPRGDTCTMWMVYVQTEQISGLGDGHKT